MHKNCSFLRCCLDSQVFSPKAKLKRKSKGIKVYLRNCMKLDINSQFRVTKGSLMHKNMSFYPSSFLPHIFLAAQLVSHPFKIKNKKNVFPSSLVAPGASFLGLCTFTLFLSSFHPFFGSCTLL